MGVSKSITGQIKAVVLAPIRVAQLATTAKSFLDHPLIGSQRLNRWGLHRARVKIADRLCRWRRRRLAKHVPHEWRKAFDRDGYVAIKNVLPRDQFETIRDAVLNNAWPAREMQQGDAITRRIAIDPDMLSAIPELKKFLDRRDIQALFYYAAGFRTTPLHYIQTIVSKCDGDSPDPQEAAHADSFHASLKSWLFLKPVSEEQGPFTYVPGSHQFTPERLEWEYQRSLADPHQIDRLSARGSPRVDDTTLRQMNLGPVQKLPVAENTLVVADTVGFHARGAATKPGERVEIWSYARRNPFQPWLGGDLLSLKGIAERRIGWLWNFRDRFEKQIGQPWRPVGKRRPLDD